MSRVIKSLLFTKRLTQSILLEITTLILFVEISASTKHSNVWLHVNQLILDVFPLVLDLKTSALKVSYHNSY